MLLRTTLKDYGQSGLATVAVRKNDIDVNFAEGGRFTIPIENLPKGVTLSNGDYNITLDKAGFKIMSVRPKAGMYKVKFVGFYHQDGQLPTPKQEDAQERNQWRSYDIPKHASFTSLYEIVESKKYTGMTIAWKQVYCFYDGDGMGTTAYMGYGSKKLEAWLLGMGFNPSTTTIPFSDNILPALEEMILKFKHTYAIVVNDKGFITTITPAED